MRTWRALAAPTAAAILCIASITLPAPEATACGGFFCNQFDPVNQIGENILFALEDELVTAHIQIQYQGPAEEFSWVLPLPSVPQMGVGTEELFRQLRLRTDPQFRVEWDNEEGCGYRSQCDCWLDDADGAPSAGGGGEQSSVDILAAGAVGPYDFKVVSSPDGAELTDWLIDNGYDVPESSKSIVQWYADIDYVFLGLKLLKDKDAGDIQPIVISYAAEDMSCIPLKLTSIAADPDMPIFSYILAGARAVPVNYFHVVLNPQAYDWLNCAQPTDSWGGCGGGASYCQQEYLDLVTRAADKAAGHGFVTEFAGQSSVMDNALWWEDRFNLEALAALTTPGAFLQEMMWQGFPSSSLVQQIIKDHIPKPEDAHMSPDCQGDQAFYSIWNIDNCVQYMPEGWQFDAVAMAADLDMKLAKPMAEAQGLFDHHPYMSRLFTTISDYEMNRDPIFSLNPELPDVDNVHTVIAKAQCKPHSDYEAESVTLTFPDGGQQTLEGTFYQCGGWDPQDPEIFDSYPPASEIQILGESGPPETVSEDDIEALDEQLDKTFPTPGQEDVMADPDRNLRPIPNTGTFATPQPTTSGGDGGTGGGGDGGCSGSGSGSPWAWLALVFGGLAVLPWRRRRHLT